MMYIKYTGKIIHVIVRIRNHSSFLCIAFHVARTTQKVQAWFKLRIDPLKPDENEREVISGDGEKERRFIRRCPDFAHAFWKE